MPRTGNQYLSQIAATPRTIWLGTEKITNPTTHPAFERTAQSFAALYDQAASDESSNILRDARVETPNGLALRAYSVPRSHEDLVNKHHAHDAWARSSFGFLGRSPDYMAAGAAGWAAQPSAFVKEGGYDGSTNAVELHRRLAEGDLFAAFTITNPSTDRSRSIIDQGAGDLLMHVDEERSDGIVISGAKTIGTAAVFADEIVVGSIEPLRPDDVDFAFTVVIPPDAEGVSLVSRTSYEEAAISGADNPISSLFDENDALLVCTRVFVPWERVLTYRDTATTARIWWATPAYGYMAHQAAVRFSVKIEFLAGLAALVAESTGAANNPAVRNELGRLAGFAHTARAIALGAESAYEVDPADAGAIRLNTGIIFAQRQFAAEVYPAVVHQLRMLCGGSLTQLPVSIRDLDAPEIGDLLRKYSRSAGQSTEERVQIMKLVWDVVGTEFASRHAHYEQFYQGAPHVYLNQLASTPAASAMTEYARTALAADREVSQR